MEALVGCLHRMWDGNIAAPLEGSFVDLGCGEGRVVIEIGARFSDRFEGGIGMDLQPDLIRQAKANARRRRLHNWCRSAAAVATATFTATPGAKYEYSSLCKGVVRCDDVIRTKPFTIRIPRWNSW